MHRTSSIFILALLAMASISGMATAEKSAGAEKSTSYVVHVTKNDFAAALFSLENAIVNRGLVIDHVGYLGKMLERTTQATGGQSPYTSARYLNFCSAKLSQAAMEANPENIAICPYVMFVYELKAEPGKARIGFRRPSGAIEPASQKAIADIEKLLTDIAQEATE